jgi:ribosome-binding protein aMBF1 (putative translation factor)
LTDKSKLEYVKKVVHAETRMSKRAPTAALQVVYDDIVQRLIEARQESGLTQREVSAQIGRAHSFLSKCETGERRVDVLELLQLAKFYKKPLQYFFGGWDNKDS